jgi:hypothetical protein
VFNFSDIASLATSAPGVGGSDFGNAIGSYLQHLGNEAAKAALSDTAKMLAVQIFEQRKKIENLAETRSKKRAKYS